MTTRMICVVAGARNPVVQRNVFEFGAAFSLGMKDGMGLRPASSRPGSTAACTRRTNNLTSQSGVTHLDERCPHWPNRGKGLHHGHEIIQNCVRIATADRCNPNTAIRDEWMDRTRWACHFRRCF